MTKIQSRKASGTMETCVNVAVVSFFVTVLENRKKIWFVEVAVVFLYLMLLKNHSHSYFCVNIRFCSIKI